MSVSLVYPVLFAATGVVGVVVSSILFISILLFFGSKVSSKKFDKTLIGAMVKIHPNYNMSNGRLRSLYMQDYLIFHDPNVIHFLLREWQT